MKSKSFRLLLLVAVLAAAVWSSPATSEAVTCPIAHCNVFRSECTSTGGTPSEYIMGFCLFGGGAHTLIELTCNYTNGNGPWAEQCWDN